jgi:hypothetical protein
LAVEPTDFKAALEELRDRIPTLSTAGPCAVEFASWLESLYSIVKRRFGVESNEMRQLREIGPELPAEFYDSIERRLSSPGLGEALTRSLLMSLYRDTPQDVFRKPLTQYSELITTLMHDLGSNS